MSVGLRRQLGRLGNRSLDLLFLPPFDPLWRRRCSGRVHCLLYHRVDEPGRVPVLDRFGVPPIPPAALEAELDFLRRQGALFLTFADLLAGTFPAPHQRGVIVCFDDGLRDNYTHGLAVLERLGIPATFFQSTALIDADRPIWEHLLYWHGAEPRRAAALAAAARLRLPAAAAVPEAEMVVFLRECCSWAELEPLLAHLGDAEAAAADLCPHYPTAADVRRAHGGGHEIGSHGHQHLPRRAIDAAGFERELVRSLDTLQSVLGTRPTSFSYPFDSRLPGDAEICARHVRQVATVAGQPITRASSALALPRFTWPGPHRSPLHRRRWLWRGRL